MTVNCQLPTCQLPLSNHINLQLRKLIVDTILQGKQFFVCPHFLNLAMVYHNDLVGFMNGG